MAKTNKPLKVGFDLDGVILYNPARIVRPLIVWVKRNFLKRKKTSFYVPKTKWEQAFWRLFHKSSIFIAPGYQDLKQAVKSGRIEAYLITGRFNHLKPDFDRWVKKMNARHIFKGIYLNEKDEQPHLFKQRLAQELGLDVFVDDNWDIVNFFHQQYHSKKSSTQPFWIYNFLDRHVDYNHKFPHLKHAVVAMTKRVKPATKS